MPVRKATRPALAARKTDWSANRSTQADSLRWATIAKQVSNSSAEPRSTIWAPKWDSTSASQDVEEQDPQERQDEGHTQQVGDPEQPQLGEHRLDHADHDRHRGDFQHVDAEAHAEAGGREAGGDPPWGEDVHDQREEHQQSDP